MLYHFRGYGKGSEVMSNIPKIINYCWFGGNEKSEKIKKCIESWKKICPDYKIIEWNEKNFDININEYVKEAYNSKKWAFVSDYARLWIIYNYGGIYLDTDVELLKKLDKLLEYEAFFACENIKYVSTGLGFGAKKGNKLIKNILDDYNNLKFINKNGEYDTTPCPVRNTKVFNKYLNLNENYDKVIIRNSIIILPKEFFCPLDYETGKIKKTKNTIAIHWYEASWLNENQIKLNKIKLKLSNLPFLGKIIYFIYKFLFLLFNDRKELKKIIINRIKKGDENE